ncbi:putative bifunctional diguanylate cyclase/phosphodiesterase [Marinicella litoralis]|uniref:Diguanylate cyclase (GGDEF)-like protein n=1 Tax=Marinicella litoralis TaxID=644220 RepID=A0A4R6XG99_9GAMM|nr:GGDEF domain-containing phosphodiesterase [Marinicella litoralis]TDR16297.1 diguanylate cyclase (GGDEF)-like protein [Marinicella litoralis]
MTFLNKNILIACSDKKDRLQFFNYFDDLDAEKIFTASDYGQMNDLLSHSEEKFDILAFEISTAWIKNLEKIKQIIEANENLKLIAVVSSKMNMTPSQHAEIEKYVDGLFYSPVTQQELLAKGSAMNTRAKEQRNHSIVELDDFLGLHFQLTSLPKALIDTSTHQIIEVNDAFVNEFKIKNKQSKGQVWHQVCQLKNQSDVEKVHARLNETGQYTQNVGFEVGSKIIPVQLNFYTTVFDDKTYYLVEFVNQSEKLFYERFLKYLSQITELNFEQKQSQQTLQKMLQWMGLDFCFIVNNNLSNQNQKLLWDSSLNNYAEYYIGCEHDFIDRKLKTDLDFDIEKGANKDIPGDEFLSFYGVSSFMAFNCSIDNENQVTLVVGSIKNVHKWNSFKILFGQLALHYKQTMAFKALQFSHESESQYDVLTELMNRRYIVKRIEQSIDNNIHSHVGLAVLFIDLDRFKVINDSLGHDVGDDVLVKIAQILKNNVQDYGVAARYAGDEFLVLLDKQVNQETVNEIAKNILIDAANPIKLNNGSEIKLTLSIGGAYFPEHGSTVSKLIKHADIALYNAKLNGKNRFTIYNNTLDGDQAKQSEEMVRNLQAAIELDQIEVYYQPKINASTEDIMGFEALVRWEHPELGIISPGLFIPLAEQTDLIYPIGLLVIEKAAECLKKWQKQYKIPLTMSVNLSPIQLNDKDLTSKISHIIDKTGIHPKHLDFEITESEKFKSVKDALLMFKKIVNLGCTLSIDDFGTGHSTLDYLRKIPAKTLKIDQVFVKNIGLSPDDEAILDATIDMAKRVGHFIVAEGVETEEQRQYLTNKGCDYFQGYLFCRPLPKKEIERILLQREEILKNN